MPRDPSRPARSLRTEPPRIGQSLMVHFDSGTPPVLRMTTPLVRRCFHVCMAMVEDSVAAADLTRLQYGILAYLNKQDGEPGIDQNSLAARLGIERSHVSLLLEELELRGLLDRQVNGADRRARVLRLTTKGENLFARLRPNNVVANDRILEPLEPNERKLFLDMLLRIVDRNAVSDRPSAGRRRHPARRSAANKGSQSHHSKP